MFKWKLTPQTKDLVMNSSGLVQLTENQDTILYARL